MDGVNIRNIGLHELRSKISIIPQDPFLFRATLRRNLNTGSKYSDDALWESLKVVGLADVVSANPEGLDLEVSDNPCASQLCIKVVISGYQPLVSSL